MNKEEFKKKLFELFTSKKFNCAQDYFIDMDSDNFIDTLTVEETEKQGACKVTFTNSLFIKFCKIHTNKGNIQDFFRRDEKSKSSLLRKICDGIFLFYIENKMYLCLVELKKTIIDNFGDVIKQIEGSFLKISMFLSLIIKPSDFNVICFIGGNLEKIDKPDPDIDYGERVEEFREKDNNLEKTLKEFSREKQVKINLPFFLDELINETYKKKDVYIYHLDCEKECDLSDFICN